MGAANVEPDPLRVALTDPDVPLLLLDELELPELEPQALTPTAITPAVAAASHLRDMECFSFVRFIAARVAERWRQPVTDLCCEFEKAVNVRRRTGSQRRNGC